MQTINSRGGIDGWEDLGWAPLWGGLKWGEVGWPEVGQPGVGAPWVGSNAMAVRVWGLERPATARPTTAAGKQLTYFANLRRTHLLCLVVLELAEPLAPALLLLPGSSIEGGHSVPAAGEVDASPLPAVHRHHAEPAKGLDDAGADRRPSRSLQAAGMMNDVNMVLTSTN